MAVSSIDGLIPLKQFSPGSAEELSAIIQTANAAGQAVYPVGGQTMTGFGLPPTKPGVAVDLTGLNQVIDYPARDMTITVQAGIRIAELQAILAKENQELPVDVPLPDRATLGGSIAVNASGPRRFGYGTLRDYVIGISLMNDQGETFKAGGRVVKNVAGYDLMKLATGSLGTLGIITQVTLKVKPKAGAGEWLVLPCPEGDVATVIAILGLTRTRPVAVVLKADGPNREFTVGYEDNPPSVAWQVKQLREELPDSLRSRLGVLPPHEAEKYRVTQRDFPLLETSPVTFKANVVPAMTWEFVKRAGGLGPVEALFGNGIVFGHLPDVEAVPRLQAAAGECGGNLVLLRCPTAAKTLARVWGRPAGDLELMRAVKKNLDPQNLFNPGRFVGGI
ncbi:FAD-binding oxidoreductase [Zavarzinella formosa]|uniref:FAD-binding oxidoreductase n=1 Tax=Zavarzinella formosa TaxID=360055 RepID=UPI0002EAE694|nr:FAD-binding oxidoreductase [Zavarzinella formosa]